MHQHQQHVGRAMEGEHVERDELRRLRAAARRRRPHRRRRGVDRHQPPVDRDADRAGAQRIVPDRAQRQAERRHARSRRASTNSTNSTAEAVGIGGACRRCRTRTGPSTGAIVMPCRPSAPPVSQDMRFATSSSSSATPSVTISRVRSEPRSTRKLVTKPEQRRATAAADAGPSSGSPMTRASPEGPPHRRRGRRRPHGRATRCRHSRGSRSSESANSAEDRDLVQQEMASGRRKRVAAASTQKAISATPAIGGSRGCVRRDLATGSTQGASASIVARSSDHRLRGEEALRAQDQHDDHERVDDEGADAAARSTCRRRRRRRAAARPERRR